MPLSWWEKRLDNPLDRLLGGFDGDELAGIVGLAFEPREKARHKVTLFGMYVTEAYQRKGLGRRLVEAALDEARQHPRLKVIQLTVTAGNAAAFALYQRCGFIQYGLEPLAVRVGVEYFDKIHMWRELQEPTESLPVGARAAFESAQRALTPSKVENDVSLAVSKKSRIYGASSMSARIPAYSVANKPFSPRRLAFT